MMLGNSAALFRSTLVPVMLVASLFVTGQASADTPPQWRSGQEVYAKICHHCHDTGVGPVLTGRGLPAEYFEAMARHPRPAMPAFRVSEIDDASLRALALYLAAAPPKGKPDTPPKQSGSAPPKK